MVNGKFNNGIAEVDQLSKNMLHLREIHGESQSDLGDVLGVTKNAISNYETGVRKLDQQKIEKLAKHYNISADELLHTDFTGLPKIDMPSGETTIKSIFSVLLPLSSTPKALQNEKFRNAYNGCCEIVNELFELRPVNNTTAFKYYDEFAQLADEEEMTEAVANIVWFVFLEYTQLTNSNVGNEAILLLHPSNYRSTNAKSILKAGDKIDIENEKKRKEFIKQNEEVMTLSLKIMKSDPAWSDLADYYLALTYFLTMIDSGLSDEMNTAVGKQMMLSYAKLGNPYALKFWKTLLK